MPTPGFEELRGERADLTARHASTVGSRLTVAATWTIRGKPRRQGMASLSPGASGGSSSSQLAQWSIAPSLRHAYSP